MNQLVRLATLATAITATTSTAALAQRNRGTMGTPAAPPPAPAPMTVPSGGVMSTPMGPFNAPPRSGDLPRMVTEPPRRPMTAGFGYTLGGGYSTRDRDGRMYWYDSYDRDARYRDDRRDDRGYRGDDRFVRRERPGYTTYSPYVRRPIPCTVGCVRYAGGLRVGRVFGSFVIGYPFYVPIVVPYIYDATYVRYGEPVVDAYVPPTNERPASKLIVVGAGTGGGDDALTVETRGDSVKLSWIGTNRAAREVKLFVSDSAQRQLASRSASPSAPSATFEIATLSSPVAFAGVSVTFTDGVTSTTVVPYRGSATTPRR